MKRLAIFDCDGTLVDSQANICVCVEDAFGRAKLDPPDRESIRRIVGLSLVEAMAALAPEADGDLHRAMAADYKDAFFRLRTSGTMSDEPLFDGIAELLVTLADDGWLLGVATGKSDRGLAHILAAHGIAASVRHAPDRRPPSVQAASVDDRGGTCRSRGRGRPGGDDRRHQLRH